MPDVTPAESLTKREHEVIEHIARGLKNGEIARVLGTTEHVIKNYCRVIYDKLGFSNRVEIALWHESRQHHGSSDASAASLA